MTCRSCEATAAKADTHCGPGFGRGIRERCDHEAGPMTWGEACERLGWGFESQVTVLLGYIVNQDSPEAFCDHLAILVAEEEEATQ